MEIKKETAHYFHVQFLAVVENQFLGLLRSRRALSNVCIRFYQCHSLICLVPLYSADKNAHWEFSSVVLS